jgi:hypothetical protein
MVEIVQKHVTSPEVQEAIAQDLMGLAVAAQVEQSGNVSSQNTLVLSAPVGRPGKAVAGQVVI